MAGEQRPILFVSYSDSVAATELDHILDRAFEGQIQLFNTSMSRSGLSAGDEIDPALLDQVRRSACFVSLWTPSAIRRPAWMSWELGAATASAVPVVIARALGVRPDELPLNLSARYAPDVGDLQQLLAFVRTISRLLGDIDYSEGIVRAEFARDPNGPSPLRAKLVPQRRIRLTIHARRALLENESTASLEELDIVSHDDDAEPLIIRIQEELVGRDRKLAARERLVVPLERQSIVSGSLRFEWIADDTGRQQQDVRVRPAGGS